MKILGVIPSRIGSTRLPRKPLLDIQGKPMIQRVYENARRCSTIDRVIVATDSEEIAQVVVNCGGEVAFTDTNLKTGSDRVANVARNHPDYEIVINLQGDEPFIQPQMLEELAQPLLADPHLKMATLAHPLMMSTEYQDPRIVKVITGLNSDALYFSRAPIPYQRVETSKEELPVYHHMGIYAFRRDFLLHYTTLPQTPLELAESLEQLRALEHGYAIRVKVITQRTLEINTAEDLAQAQLFPITQPNTGEMDISAKRTQNG